MPISVGGANTSQNPVESKNEASSPWRCGLSAVLTTLLFRVDLPPVYPKRMIRNMFEPHIPGGRHAEIGNASFYSERQIKKDNR